MSFTNIIPESPSGHLTNKTPVDEDLESISSGSSLTGSTRKGNNPGEQLAQKETRLVNRSKWLVYLVILLSAALVGSLTYFFMEKEEKVWYQDEFEEFAEEVFETTQGRLTKLQESTQTLASSWTAHATHGPDEHALHDLTTNPNVTLPNFGVFTSDLRSLGRARFMATAPVLTAAEAPSWEMYAVDHQDWIWEDLEAAHDQGVGEEDSDDGDGDDHDHDRHRRRRRHRHRLLEEESEGQDDEDDAEPVHPGSIHSSIYGSRDGSDWRVPLWQMHPTPTDASNSPVMMDLNGYEWFRPLLTKMIKTRSTVFSPPFTDLDFLLDYPHNHDPMGHDSDDEDDDYRRRKLHQIKKDEENDDDESSSPPPPYTLLINPIFETFKAETAAIVGVAVAVVNWQSYFSDVLEDEALGMLLDLEYSCGGDGDSSRYAFLTTEDEGTVAFLGYNVTQDQGYNDMAQRKAVTGEEAAEGSDSSDDGRRRKLQASVQDSDDGDDGVDRDDHEDDPTGCDYYVSTIATVTFVDNWQRADAVTYTLVVVSIFVFTALVFLLYDMLVQRRNNVVSSKAVRSTAIVASLFPKNVADQMMNEANHGTSSARASSTTRKTLEAMGTGADTAHPNASAYNKPIADLFPDTTILFADIAGFTAWASMREPAQVFTLLETVFNAYDKIAERRKVFKVETVGDCYVAVCGLPNPNKDHAIVMCRFARDALVEMGRLTKQLELELGPDTSTLNMRFGLHSGPVTAGVLRGQRARFQLFGDTMNKASRIETSGQAGRIHLSKETADLLIGSGRSHWVSKREDAVDLKGLGQLNTYWLSFQSEGTVGVTESSTSGGGSSDTASNSNTTDPSHKLGIPFSSTQGLKRGARKSLIAWHKEILAKALVKIVALRAQQQPTRQDEQALEKAESKAIFGNATPSSCVTFPNMEGVTIDEESVQLNSLVEKQLASFVKTVIDRYNPNPFHNAEHCSHVVMSVTKLLTHMESSSDLSLDDPMTQFVVILTALIHDVDHPSVSNQQLMEEQHFLTSHYDNSFAERNSLDVTWEILEQDKYLELRRTLYTTVQEFEHFRQLLVHAVLVTDIMDKDLQKERKERWDHCFNQVDAPSSPELLNLQKTAVLETIIQVSDVSHTMQHWKVYQKWNHRLYRELSEAFHQGRASKNPAEFWYQGEIGFFDHYIIPLAARLKECPAFYMSGEELLLYAKDNRKEWEMKGQEVVESLKGDTSSNLSPMPNL
ncbi:MAG: hypothetical protein SGILL_004243 [Bacillariaceae sp.]